MVRGILRTIFCFSKCGKGGWQQTTSPSLTPYSGYKSRVFDMMSKKIGRDIGNNIGNFMAADFRSWSSDQAKFIRIQVYILLDKPLRRCRVVASPKREKFQIYFHYERLPVFSFLCGVMGHDDQHCTCSTRQMDDPPLYGDWLRARDKIRWAIKRMIQWRQRQHST